MHASLPQLLTDSARRHPERPAVMLDAGAVTYGQLADAVDLLAARLAERGLAGRRLGILLPNLPVFPLALYGVLRAAGRALMLNPMNSPREVREYLTDAQVDTVVTVSALRALLPRGTRALLVDDLPAALRDVGDGEAGSVPLQGAPPPPPRPAGGHSEAAVLYTAASGGWAKGAVLSHANLLANQHSTAEALQLSAEDRVVAALPLIHAFGFTVSLNATLGAGAAMIPVERFNPLKLLDLLESSGATVLSGVPAMFIGMLAAMERRGVPDHRLRATLCGGAPLPVEVALRWEETVGVPLRQGYGLTEAGPVCLFNRLDRPNRPGTLGHPLADVEVSIRDEAGSELPAGEVGELCVRGPNVFNGYLGDGGRRASDFHGDWLRTGDLASQEPDGVIRFRGMLKPMFTRNGFNIYPREVERVLEQDPRVASATVCALPEPARENDVVVVVRAAEGASVTEEDLREVCRAGLAAYKQPTRIHLM